jgi:tyrosyl-tRNA synthetase
MASNIFQTLKHRRLLNQITHQSLLTEAPPLSKAVYVGFDPTAESIHLGNLVSLIALNWFRAHGYQPIVLFGGATGLIGDPSGKAAERKLLHPDDVQHNVHLFTKQFQSLNENMQSHLPTSTNLKDIIYVNNFDFYKDMSMLGFMRDVGKHFRVNTMLSRDSVKSRLSAEADEGISFTEFSYQILQAYDFYQLY